MCPRGHRGQPDVFADQDRHGLAREQGICLGSGEFNLQRVDDGTRSDDAGLRIELNWGRAAVTLERREPGPAARPGVPATTDCPV